MNKAGTNAVPQAVDLQMQVKQLQESLALANAEAETVRQQWQDLRLRNQAMGVDALTGDEKKLEARLVEAVKELYQTEQERRSAVDRLQQLLDAGKQLLKNASIDPKRRAEYEVAVRAAKDFLDTRPNTTTSSPVDLTQGRVEHVNGELNTVIVNLGSDLGVKPGMPFRVVRGEEIIGRLKAFEVRETVCAAVVESVENGKELKMGDQVSVAAEK